MFLGWQILLNLIKSTRLSLFVHADLPSVLSGNRLFIIDPHEKYFKVNGATTSGYTWNLTKQRAEVRRLADQFDPYRVLFDCSLRSLDNGWYDGTMFRFPIRLAPSPLSDLVYTHDKVMELFSSFESNAYLILVFLKHLEEIVLCTRASGDAEPQRIFSVRVAESCLESVRRRRREFMAAIVRDQTPATSIRTTYLLEVETIRYKKDGSNRMDVRRLLVSEMYGGADVSVKLQTLQQDPKLGLLPLVGATMELKYTAEEGNPEHKLGGQVFCFLPLAVEQKSSTGLPVHVNGYFAVGQNRRHLRWPSTGQSISSDRSLQWNRCLLSRLVPQCYVNLILSAIRYNQSSSTKLSVHDVYAAVPDMEEVDQKWSIVLKPFFVRLLEQHAVLHTDLDGGKWIRVNEAFFDCLTLTENRATRKQVVDVLLAANVPVVTVPSSYLKALGQFTTCRPQVITPSFVRTTLRYCLKAYDNLKSANKLLLLQYVLKDQDFGDLSGLMLLPLANGKFIYFKWGMYELFLANEECPKKLLPGLEHRLIADDLSEELTHQLTKVVNEGMETFFLRLSSRAYLSLSHSSVPMKFDSLTD